MCTALTLLTNDHYFGRNLDLEYAYKETVTITPNGFPLVFRHSPALLSHYAMIGMAFVSDNYPLYYDATNEKGLSIAGLNFPKNAAYRKPQKGIHNITSFELIPWILGQCSTVRETRTLLRQTNLIDEPFDNKLPLSPLHFIISDRSESLTVEPMSDGLKLYPNPLGVLTNNPSDVSPKQLYASIATHAEKFLFRRISVGNLQQRNGCSWHARRLVQPVPICKDRVSQTQLRLRPVGGRKCKSVFPPARGCRTPSGCCNHGQRTLRDYPLFFLLQY